MSYYSEMNRDLTRGTAVSYIDADKVKHRGICAGLQMGGGVTVEFSTPVKLRSGETATKVSFGAMGASDLWKIPESTLAVEAAIAFIEGFVGDELQDGLPEKLVARLLAILP